MVRVMTVSLGCMLPAPGLCAYTRLRKLPIRSRRSTRKPAASRICLASPKVLPRTPGTWNSWGPLETVNVLVLDGLLVGYWRRTQTRSAIAITVHPGRKLSRAERAALTVAFGRYGTYWDTAIELSWAAPGDIRFAHDTDPETLP